MTARPQLEVKGNFLTHPFAELLTEISRARLSGSLRVTDGEKKSVIYFKSGQVVFAVSNARSSRIFDILLRRNKVAREDLAKIPNFANDLELAGYLQNSKLLSKEECDRLFAVQIEGIIVEALSQSSADWIFSPLARIKDGLEFPVDTRPLLIEYGRCMPVQVMLGRFRSLDEAFERSDLSEVETGLHPGEAFVLSRADEGRLSVARLISVAGMSEANALQAIYTLWLGGLLERTDWQPPFSAASIAAMKNAKLELKKEAVIATPQYGGETTPAAGNEIPEEVQLEKVITVEEYLERVESSTTHYDVLGVDSSADIPDLKAAYFGLARMFHPDRYHAEGGDLFKRVQDAFTHLAQAHETLKNNDTRDIYDYRMRKELAEREKRAAEGFEGQEGVRAQQGSENFERGFSLLMDDETEAAMPFFARAVHFAPQNARYHAYYGKALSSDATQRFKAESEMQAAVKLDPDNPVFRILLAEFFIQFNLLKRAEGELTRLLAVFPSNQDARDLLNSIKK